MSRHLEAVSTQVGQSRAKKHTPWLDVKGDDGLGSRLDLAGLLLVVLSKALLLDAGSLSVLLLVVTVTIFVLVVQLLGPRTVIHVRRSGIIPFCRSYLFHYRPFFR